MLEPDSPLSQIRYNNSNHRKRFGEDSTVTYALSTESVHCDPLTLTSLRPSSVLQRLLTHSFKSWGLSQRSQSSLITRSWKPSQWGFPAPIPAAAPAASSTATPSEQLLTAEPPRQTWTTQCPSGHRTFSKSSARFQHSPPHHPSWGSELSPDTVSPLLDLNSLPGPAPLPMLHAG